MWRWTLKRYIFVKRLIIGERAITKYNGMMRSRTGGIYLRPEVKRFENICKAWVAQQWDGPALECPIRVNITFSFDNNKMPDLFNLPKAVCDALNGVVYKDDRQIVCGDLIKQNAGENNIEIEIWTVQEDSK